MLIDRRSAVMGTFVAFAYPARGQGAFPSRPVTMLVPLAAGSAGDIAARLVGQRMAVELGHPIVVENVPGASGLIGVERGARAAPDGHTIIGVGDSGLTMAPQLNPNARLNPLTDLAPITQLCTIEWALVVHPAFEARSVEQFVARAKARPGQINFASGGIAGPQHVAMEAFRHRVGIELSHVPYRGATQALTDVVAGVVPVMFTATSVAVPFLRNGQLRALATAGARRSDLLADVPTLIEAGVSEFTYETWMALLAPAQTPRAAIDRLHAAAVVALRDREIASRLTAVGLSPLGNTPDEFRAALARDYARMGDLIRVAGIRAE
jgi:tripartite-type tricarboxylate transporter receptor subunit TctC